MKLIGLALGVVAIVLMFKPFNETQIGKVEYKNFEIYLEDLEIRKKEYIQLTREILREYKQHCLDTHDTIQVKQTILSGDTPINENVNKAELLNKIFVNQRKELKISVKDLNDIPSKLFDWMPKVKCAFVSYKKHNYFTTLGIIFLDFVFINETSQ
jgi:hypothetical protein